uniref:PSQ10.7c n=1 Tax=Nocardiopsis sp. 90127 TaxID=373213 RepID=Q27I81_9ACTN|nr:hypothetical protein [Nocardiopsis sp. 90127]ABD48730.1 pSQ10.7c [Nocardiopsis sp. 90127]
MIHRTCRAKLAETETALREAQDRASRLGERIVIETQRADQREELLLRASDAALDQRLAHHTERERLRSELAAARAEIHELQCRVNDLEEEDSSHQSVLEARRRRAAEKALGGAWDGPGAQESGHRAQVARALLALPLASFDVAVAHERDGQGGWDWTVDGHPVNTRSTGFYGTSETDVLTGRYGFTEEELDKVRRDAHRALWERMGLPQEAF